MDALQTVTRHVTDAPRTLGLDEHHTTLRQGAFLLGLERVADATRVRGF